MAAQIALSEGSAVLVQDSTLGVATAKNDPSVLTAPDSDQGFLTNFAWWADNGDEMNERFAAWLLQ